MANGDITYSNPGGELNAKAFASGRYTGLATANIDILCGFVPSRIVIHNDTDNTTYIWFKGIAQGSMFQITEQGIKSLEVVTGAPTPLAASGTNTAGEGFRIPLGTTTVLNTTGDDCYWEAWR